LGGNSAHHQEPDAVITVICAPDDGWLPPKTRRAVNRNVINCIQSHLVGQLLTLIHDARTHEHKKTFISNLSVIQNLDDPPRRNILYLLNYGQYFVSAKLRTIFRKQFVGRLITYPNVNFIFPDVINID
jgi:hypothetical protein